MFLLYFNFSLGGEVNKKPKYIKLYGISVYFNVLRFKVNAPSPPPPGPVIQVNRTDLIKIFFAPGSRLCITKDLPCGRPIMVTNGSIGCFTVFVLIITLLRHPCFFGLQMRKYIWSFIYCQCDFIRHKLLFKHSILWK